MKSQNQEQQGRKGITHKIKLAIMVVAVFAFAKANAQLNNPEAKKHHFGIGLNGGVTTGDYEDIYSSNIGLDLYYLYGISEKFYLGGSTGFANYFGEDVNIPGLGEVEFDDAQFIPVAGSFRFSPFSNFAVGADVGYAIGVNDGNDGGFYASPRATYFLADKFPVFAGYRLIDLDGESLGSIQFGIGYKF
ncbi:outer membrane beta-barrel protein [Winogradskyella forsetii]|uniref:outer membrane beta-barrel protein n=1 Tax=Winogradskyella forsetii TaxID=2686077 RepID=UPI0015CE094E|nr:outer membrane beta-barrel protein [Winogradskyella forsetii]